MPEWNAHPVVITAAITGADVTRDTNPNLPYTPSEIAESSLRSLAAGATVVALHAREDDGTPSGRPELFQDAIRRIRESAPNAVVNVSTGGSSAMSLDERLGGLEVSPDMCGVETGSMNFGDGTFITSPAAGREIITRARTRNIALEVEAFEVGHVISAVRLLEEGLLPGPLRVNLVFGVPGGIDASPEALDAMLRPLPPDTFWSVTCVGRHHERILALALLRGACGVRTGLEDVAYISKGVLAPSNEALVSRLADLAATLGRQVTTVEQARELLRIG
ncbi:3-keto-5-aminohexanoate cleavage protein [Streptomyces cadmiisoli]|uniref:3-keto-5-aminohexanoate cleavage protein n=1 Tax=Streptomyces cadmiisoli TaxID=2184053 RepID=A0A2Z4JED1_9ACTN|nr:3-keto-5-aminohexanoate cleavage protein [Streptomyces cadmiisoli]AWW43337.1 3-keto-5-aminohexanoate cleavage protein [Streptomyces cadmiisoli]